MLRLDLRMLDGQQELPGNLVTIRVLTRIAHDSFYDQSKANVQQCLAPRALSIPLSYTLQ